MNWSWWESGWELKGIKWPTSLPTSSLSTESRGMPCQARKLTPKQSKKKHLLKAASAQFVDQLLMKDFLQLLRKVKKFTFRCSEHFIKEVRRTGVKVFRHYGWPKILTIIFTLLACSNCCC